MVRRMRRRIWMHDSRRSGGMEAVARCAMHQAEAVRDRSREGAGMTRWLVLVEIDAATPLDAEVAVGIALTGEVGRKPFVRQTQVRLPSASEAKPATEMRRRMGACPHGVIGFCASCSEAACEVKDCPRTANRGHRTCEAHAGLEYEAEVKRD